MNFLTKKYINLISPRLEKFAWKNNNLASLRCPLCGDSKKNKRKARGNFYSYNGEDFYNCYNCGEPQGFASFLYNFDKGLYREYKLEKFQESIISTKKEDTFDEDVETFKSKPKSKPLNTESPLDSYKKFSQLKEDHPARKYAELRKLEPFFDKIYYIVNFPLFTEDFPGLKNWGKIDKHSRMIFPCYSKNKELIGFSARAFLDDQVRYCTWKDKEVEDKVLYGLDTVDESKTVYVVEGVVDSLMIDNAVAVMSSALNSVDMFDDKVLIFDNQPRSLEIVKLVKKAIEDKKKVVIWPDSFPAKDLNEAVCDYDYTREDLINLIKKSTYSGLMAEVQFKRWKKV